MCAPFRGSYRSRRRDLNEFFLFSIFLRFTDSLNGSSVMIRLTRLNQQPIVVNAELIEYLETTPDTVISLVNGQKMTVLETLEQVMAEIVNYQRVIREKPLMCPIEEPL